MLVDLAMMTLSLPPSSPTTNARAVVSGTMTKSSFWPSELTTPRIWKVLCPTRRGCPISVVGRRWGPTGR